MSRIDELIAELCPDGTSYVGVTEAADYVRGVTYNKNNEQSDGPVKVLRANNITLASNTLNLKDIKRVSASVRVRENQRLIAGDILICAGSGSKAHIGKVAYIEHEIPYTFGGFMGVLRSNGTVYPRFLYHLLAGRTFAKYLDGALSTTTINNLNAGVMKGFRIPIPPLEVQQEIARILDQFTQLEAELEAELAVRTRQRHALAAAHSGATYIPERTNQRVEHVNLGAIMSQYVEPVRISDDVSYTNLGVKWYGEGVLSRDPKPGREIKAKTLFRVKPGQFLYNRMFVVEGSFGIVPEHLAYGVVSNEFPAYDLDRARVSPEWLLLYLLDEFTLKRITAEVTGVERGSMKSRRRWKEQQLEAFEIALPPIGVQHDMVRQVSAVTALESALGNELAARRQQFEYYRDRLMTFDEVTA